MATTEEIGESTPQTHDTATDSLGESFERFMADVDRRLTQLLEDIRHTAQSSAAFEGGQKDAKRLMKWFDAKAKEVRTELNKLGKDASNTAHKVKETVTGKDHKSATASHSAGPEERPNGDGD